MIKDKRLYFLLLCIVPLILTNIALATNKVNYKTPIKIIKPNQLKWTNGPGSVKLGDLLGDQSKAAPFITRRLLPAHFRAEPHYHPIPLSATVLSGTLHIGVAKVFDKAKTEALPVGSFVFIPAWVPHIIWTKGPVIIEVYGKGP